MKKRFLLSLLLVVCSTLRAFGADAPIACVDRPDTGCTSDLYVGNRAPLAPSPLMKLPIGAIEPAGWVRRQLELEADGYTGHLPEISRFLREEDNAWLSPEGEGHSGWEEVPYWLKGFGDVGYVLGDQRIIQEARKWIEAALASQRDDGYFGPRSNLNKYPAAGGKPDLWPNMVMLNVLQSYYEHSGDERVLKLMTGYFRWELTIPDDAFLPPFWQQQRAGDNMASVYWLYNRTGDERLLELATKIQCNMANWTGEVASWHGVNICQCFRSPAIYFMQSGNPEHFEATLRNYRTVMGMYGQVPGGMFGADENCRPGYSGPRQGAESCSIVEMMLSHEILLKITGDPKWADRCEEVAFNSLPASMTADLKALHYLTAPNMVLCDRRSKSPGLQNGGAMLLFDPHAHRCCQHNVAHGWPYYAEHLWMATPDGGLAAVLYAACEVKAKVGEGTEVAITESTRYPFEQSIELAVATPKPVRFPLYLRVPGWCDGAEVKINGKAGAVISKPGSYLVIDRTWADGDTVTLDLPAKITLTAWAKNHYSVSVSRGPLTYSLKIGEKLIRAGGTDAWPAWEIHPTTPWNYGLELNPDYPAAGFEVVDRPWPDDDQPFEAEAAPIQLRSKARKIPEWKLDRLGLVGSLQDSPVMWEEPGETPTPAETVTLIPMGCARLRIAAFPVIGTGPEVNRWVAPPSPTPTAASHCWGSDTVWALSDGQIPQNSNDHGIPRFTWWDHRGTTEWVAYKFDKPRKVSQVEVYWFDDTGVGQCRVPNAWYVEWRDGETWKPVAGAGPCGTEPDQFNRVTFDPVTVGEIRLSVELQPEFSAGILEWRVK